MNVTDKVLNDSDYREKYLNKLNELDNMKNSFIDLQKQIAENKKKEDSKKKGGKTGKDVLVTGATKKEDIRKLIATLHEKISDIQSDDDDMKIRNIRINVIQQKINALQRILIKIEQQERQKDNVKKKDKIRDSVYLTKDDLTIKNNQDSTANFLGTYQPAIDVSTSDIIASFMPTVEAPTVDIEV